MLYNSCVNGIVVNTLVTSFILQFHSLQTSSQLKRDGDTVSLSKIIRVEKRLLAIPLMYIFLRMWGTTQFFYSLVVSGYNKEGCIPPNIRTGYLVLGILQVLCNSIITKALYHEPVCQDIIYIREKMWP